MSFDIRYSSFSIIRHCKAQSAPMSRGSNLIVILHERLPCRRASSSQ